MQNAACASSDIATYGTLRGSNVKTSGAPVPRGEVAFKKDEWEHGICREMPVDTAVQRGLRFGRTCLLAPPIQWGQRTDVLLKASSYRMKIQRGERRGCHHAYGRSCTLKHSFCWNLSYQSLRPYSREHLGPPRRD